jgi:hypothetical protein
MAPSSSNGDVVVFNSAISAAEIAHGNHSYDFCGNGVVR